MREKDDLCGPYAARYVLVGVIRSNSPSVETVTLDPYCCAITPTGKMLKFLVLPRLRWQLDACPGGCPPQNLVSCFIDHLRTVAKVQIGGDAKNLPLTG